MVKSPKLNTSPFLSTHPYPTIDLQCSSHPSTSINAIKAHSEEANISQTSLSQTGTGMVTQQPKEPKPTLEYEFQDLHLNLSVEDHGLFTLLCRLEESKPFKTLADLGSCVNIIPLYLFKKLNIGLLEETDHIFGLADGTKSYPVGIVKYVEVHIGKLKLLNDFYVIDIKKDPETPLLVGRGFLATANAVIDCRMAKIAVEERVTRKDFLDCHLPGEWEIARDVELNPSKDTLVFRRMDKPPKNRDEAWHAKIRLIDPDGEEFTKTL
ncbi:MAK10-like protein [Tanacetum coccineum]